MNKQNDLPVPRQQINDLKNLIPKAILLERKYPLKKGIQPGPHIAGKPDGHKQIGSGGMKGCKPFRQPGMASRFKSIRHNQDRIPIRDPFTRINLRHHFVHEVLFDPVVGIHPELIVVGNPPVQLREVEDSIQIGTT